MSKNLWWTVSDGNQYWFQIFRNTTSPKQWYLQIGMLDVCGSLESTLVLTIHVLRQKGKKPTIETFTYRNFALAFINEREEFLLRQRLWMDTDIDWLFITLYSFFLSLSMYDYIMLVYIMSMYCFCVLGIFYVNGWRLNRLPEKRTHIKTVLR